MTLKAGTIIATGTPAGVGMGFVPPKFLKTGDVVECIIEGLELLRILLGSKMRGIASCMIECGKNRCDDKKAHLIK